MSYRFLKRSLPRLPLQTVRFLPKMLTFVQTHEDDLRPLRLRRRFLAFAIYRRFFRRAGVLLLMRPLRSRQIMRVLPHTRTRRHEPRAAVLLRRRLRDFAILLLPFP